MKFEIQKSDLLRLLQRTQNVIEKRNTMPILANALFVAKDDKVCVFATDLEVSVRDEAKAEIMAPGSVAVSAKSLFDLVKELNDSTVQVVRKNNNWLEIKNQKAVFNIVGTSAEDFPAFPKYETTDFFKVEGKVLHDMIEKTIYSVSNDDTRYHLNGVLFERIVDGTGTHFRMVATDGHRLSLIDKKVDIPIVDKDGDGVIIPKKGLLEVKKILESEEGVVEMAFEGSHLIVKKGPTVLMIKLIEGKYPNYKQLIPPNFLRKIGVSKENLLSCLRRVSLLSNQKSRGITLSLNQNTLEIYSSNPDMGDAKEELDIKYSGEALKIGFNARYLMDILNNIKENEVDIELNDQLSPGILRPTNDAGYTCVVMPMRI